MYTNLFSPIDIKGMKLKNRVVFPAMGTKIPGQEKYVTQQLIDYHVARVEGGCGLNFTEVCGVHGPSTPNGFLGIYDEKYVPGLKNLTDAVHEAGGKVGVQLWQGGLAIAGYGIESKFTPSDDTAYGVEGIIPAATIEEIEEIVESFGTAAKNAVLAGFDCIEFHAGHGYSPHAFLSSAWNKRTDKYGGSLENRARFSLECIKAIRDNIPKDMPLFMRVVAHDDYVENGLTIEDTIEFCKMAKEAGVDVLDVSRGNFGTAAVKFEVPPVDLPRNFNVDNAAKIRQATGMLTIAVGRINDPAQAEEILSSDKADMVVVGRGQLADPEFCNKALNGNTRSIVKCIACNQGCFDGYVNPEVPYITCLRNPALGREAEYGLVRTKTSKKVLIAGGGVAGLEAATVLKRRGHNPILCEASGSLGGQFALAGEAPRKEEMKEAALAAADVAKSEGVDIRLNTPVTEELLAEIKPDELIIAIGATARKPNIPGIDLPHVTDSHDVLEGLDKPNGQIVVIGGGLVGLEVAEYLSEQNQKVTVVEMLDEVAKDLGQLRKICVLESMYEQGIDTVTDATCSRITKDKVVLEVNQQIKEIPCDNVVIATGVNSNPSDHLVDYCNKNNIAYHIVGDALTPRRALDAISEAAEVARAL